MKRLKTFFIYFLLFSALFIGSTLLEKGMVFSMYADISGNAYNSDELTINVEKAKATNVNGYMEFNVTNDSNNNIDSSYAKIEFIDEYNLNAITDYVIIKNLEPGESKNYKINFEGDKIEKYNVSFVPEIPDKSHIINLFGWEIDATNLFGLGIDLTNINGVDITQYFSWDGMKSLASTSWVFISNLLRTVPAWGYMVGALIVIWYL